MILLDSVLHGEELLQLIKEGPVKNHFLTRILSRKVQDIDAACILLLEHV